MSLPPSQPDGADRAGRRGAPAALLRSEAVERELRDGILAGRWKPGEKLPGEREIASRLGVHRSSVREALKKLEQLRLVATRPGGRATVTPLETASVEVVQHLLFAGGALDPVLAEQLLDFREMLIVGSARLALERGSDADIAEARAVLSRLATPGLLAQEQLESVERLFALLVRASGNLLLLLVRNALRAAGGAGAQAARRRVGSALAGPDALPRARALDEALARRDVRALEDAVRALVRASRGHLLETLFAAVPGGNAGAGAS